MNAQAGPSRSHPPLHLDLANIIVDQPRYASPLATSASSTAPSLSLHRSSTQSAFYYSGLQTPRTERLSLTGSEWSISEDDAVAFGREVERSISSVMQGDGKTGGWWVDLDKTPRPSEPLRKNHNFPSRLSSIPKQLPYPPSPKTVPRPPSPDAHADEQPVALPDDSPLIRPSPLDSWIPPLQMTIPSYNSEGPKKVITYDQLPTTPETLAMFPVPHPICMVSFETQLESISGPPPPIPPRRSSRKERSGQSQEGKKPVPSTFLGSLGPKLPPPRASSLRSASARAAIAASASTPAVSAIKPLPSLPPLPPIRPDTILQQSPSSLSRQPRVRSRSAQLPVTKPDTSRDRQPSYASLSSILEDEQLPDMEATPEGSWSLRRQKLRLARAKSQPRMRKVRKEFGPWRLLNSPSGFCCV